MNPMLYNTIRTIRDNRTRVIITLSILVTLYMTLHLPSSLTQSITKHTLPTTTTTTTLSHHSSFSSPHTKKYNNRPTDGGLIDFLILGFPRTATTTLTHLLNTDLLWIPRTTTHHHHHYCPLQNASDAIHLLTSLQTYAPLGIHTRRGLSCSYGLTSARSLRLYKDYFPRVTSYIVGVRHPVEWFESVYNEMFRWGDGDSMIMGSEETSGGGNRTTMSLRGRGVPEIYYGNCGSDSGGGDGRVCTGDARFHYFLSLLGKTPLTNDELRLILPDKSSGGAGTSHTDQRRWSSRANKFRNFVTSLDSSPTKVFLYDISQLDDRNNTRRVIFREDLWTFLNVETITTNSSSSPSSSLNNNVDWDIIDRSSPINPQQQRVRQRRGMDICEPRHKKTRRRLMEQATVASRWIRQYFLESDFVVVSSRYHLETILKMWNRDPCETYDG